MRGSLLALIVLLSFAGCQVPPAPEQLQTSVVFFTGDSVALDVDAQAVIAAAAMRARSRPNAIVHVLGFAPADSGSTSYTQSLSRTRALAVIDSLVEAGIGRARIRSEPQGGVPYEMGPIESRRVEIVIGG